MPLGSCLADSMEATGLRIRKRPGRVTAWQVATTNTLLNSTSRSHTQRRYGDRRCRIDHPSSGEECLARQCCFSGPTCCSNLSGQAARILGMIHEGCRWRKALRHTVRAAHSQRKRTSSVGGLPVGHSSALALLDFPPAQWSRANARCRDIDGSMKRSTPTLLAALLRWSPE